MATRAHLRLVENTELDVLWRNFVAAKKQAEKSERIEDGIVAGKAFGKFLHAVAEEDRR